MYLPMNPTFQTVNNLNPCLTQTQINTMYSDFMYSNHALENRLAIMQAKAFNDEMLLHQKMNENIQLQQMKHADDIELLRMKQEHEEKILKIKAAQAEGMMRRTAEKEGATISAVLNSDGCFCIETTYSEIKKEVSNPVLRINDLMLLYYVNCENGERVAENITWNNGEKGFLLFGKYCTPEHFMRALEKEGEVIGVPEKRKKTVSALIYSYLIKHSDTMEIPARWGWNKTYSGWLFIESDINCDEFRDSGSMTGKNRQMRDDDTNR